ncbi:hypothetical protein ACFFX0_28765 [Citricoccus parietis]
MQDGLIVADDRGETAKAAGAGVGQASREGSRQVGGHGKHAAPAPVDGQPASGQDAETGAGTGEGQA